MLSPITATRFQLRRHCGGWGVWDAIRNDWAEIDRRPAFNLTAELAQVAAAALNSH